MEQGTALIILMLKLWTALLLTPDVWTATEHALSLPLRNAHVPLALMTLLLCIYLTSKPLRLLRRTLGDKTQLAPRGIPNFPEGTTTETAGGANLNILIPNLLLVQFLGALICNPTHRRRLRPYAHPNTDLDERSPLLIAYVQSVPPVHPHAGVTASLCLIPTAQTLALSLSLTTGVRPTLLATILPPP